jgi:hypothetical protein
MFAVHAVVMFPIAPFTRRAVAPTPECGGVKQTSPNRFPPAR